MVHPYPWPKVKRSAPYEFYDVTILFTKLAKVNDKEAFMLPLIFAWFRRGKVTRVQPGPYESLYI